MDVCRRRLPRLGAYVVLADEVEGAPVVDELPDHLLGGCGVALVLRCLHTRLHFGQKARIGGDGVLALPFDDLVGCGSPGWHQRKLAWFGFGLALCTYILLCCCGDEFLTKGWR